MPQDHRRVHWSDRDQIIEVPRRLNPLPARLGAVPIPRSKTRRALTQADLNALLTGKKPPWR